MRVYPEVQFILLTHSWEIPILHCCIANNGCDNVGFTKVTVVNPPAQPYVLDTVCAGETAKLGLDYT
jgi:hypothetical protein